MNRTNLLSNRDIANARLPDNYLRATAALRACARKFTPERYAKAVVALGDAWMTAGTGISPYPCRHSHSFAVAPQVRHNEKPRPAFAAERGS